MTKICSRSSKFGPMQLKLQNHKFFSKKESPGSLDAFVFKMMSQSNSIPDRNLFPCFYHWIILMKQFHSCIIEKLLSLSNDDQDKETQQIFGFSKLFSHNVSNTKETAEKKPLQISQNHIVSLNLTYPATLNVKKRLITLICSQKIMNLNIQKQNQAQAKVTMLIEAEKIQFFKNQVEQWDQISNLKYQNEIVSQ